MFKKFIRTAWDYKLQFISMIIILAIGIGVYLGCNIEWYSVQENVNRYIEESGYANYRIYNGNGFTKSNLMDIEDIEGVEAASRVLNINVNVKGTDKTLSLFSVEDYVVSKLHVIEGAEYDKNVDGVWLSDEYAKANNIELGDEIKVTYAQYEMKCEVVGLVKSMEFLLCVADMEQLMPEYEQYGFMYVSPKKIKEVAGISFYPQINIISDMSQKDLEEKLCEILEETVYVTGRDEHKSYIAARNEVQDGKIISTVIPTLFLIVATLTMVTTMRRIVHKERKQIGTLKALGFTDGEVIRHYMLYGAGTGLIGSILGVLLGIIIAWGLVSEDGMMSNYLDLPYWNIHISVECQIIVILIILLQMFVCAMSVRSMLKGTVAQIFRPQINSKIKSKVSGKSKIWRKLSFTTRWNIRDIRRNKMRTIMSFVGVIGCIMMLIAGLGMKSSMNEFIRFIDEELYNFETKIDVSDEATNAESMKLAEQYCGDWVASSNVKYNDSPVFLDIYDIENDMIHFYDENDKQVKLQDDGVYLCARLAKNVEVGDVIEFTPYGSNKTYSVRVAGVIRSIITENITMTKAYADSIGLNYEISSIYTRGDKAYISDTEEISVIRSKSYYIESYGAFMELLSVMVNILIVFAVILGIIVLYNLGMMGYVERERELATLQVLGYLDKSISGIVVSQNIWITVAGIAVGLPLGVKVLEVLIRLLSTEYELKMSIDAKYYVYSIIITLVVSIIVSLVVAEKSRKIDMAEAMKVEE